MEEIITFFVMNDHFGGPSVHCGQILQKIPGKGQTPPPFRHCQDFGCIWTSNPPLIAIDFPVHFFTYIVDGGKDYL